MLAYGRICTYSQIRWHLSILLPETEKHLLGSYWDRTQSPFWDALVQPGQYCSLPRWHAWEHCCCQSLNGHQSHRRTECNLENQSNPLLDSTDACWPQSIRKNHDDADDFFFFKSRFAQAILFCSPVANIKKCSMAYLSVRKGIMIIRVMIWFKARSSGIKFDNKVCLMLELKLYLLSLVEVRISISAHQKYPELYRSWHYRIKYKCYWHFKGMTNLSGKPSNSSIFASWQTPLSCSSYVQGSFWRQACQLCAPSPGRRWAMDQTGRRSS